MGRVGERRKLKPLSGRGFISLGTASKRVAVLRPSTDRQLKPIVRPPRRSSIGLVRLTSVAPCGAGHGTLSRAPIGRRIVRHPARP